MFSSNVLVFLNTKPECIQNKYSSICIRKIKPFNLTLNAYTYT